MQWLRSIIVEPDPPDEPEKSEEPEEPPKPEVSEDTKPEEEIILTENPWVEVSNALVVIPQVEDEEEFFSTNKPEDTAADYVEESAGVKLDRNPQYVPQQSVDISMYQKGQAAYSMMKIPYKPKPKVKRKPRHKRKKRG